MASELPEGITQKELDELAKLDRAIKKASTRYNILKDKVKQVFLKSGTFVHGDVVIKRGTSKRFDAKAFEEAYPYEKHPLYYQAAINTDAIPADLKAKFRTTSETLSISVAE